MSKYKTCQWVRFKRWLEYRSRLRFLRRSYNAVLRIDCRIGVPQERFDRGIEKLKEFDDRIGKLKAEYRRSSAPHRED